MGIVAAAADVASEGGNLAIDTYMTTGPAVGSIFIAITLIFVLGYLYLLGGVETDRSYLRKHLVAVSVPLFIGFAAVVAYSSLQAI